MATHRWTRLSTSRRLEEWETLLESVANPEHTVFVMRPDSSSLKIEVFGDELLMRKLENAFGGRISRVHADMAADASQAPRRPLSIRGKFRVFSNYQTWQKERTAADIFVPAGMAFGTGDHATTASCLRLLCDSTAKLAPGFSIADLGCGSGILAIAAERLGASFVEALDNDSDAVRIAEENAQINFCKNIFFVAGDVLRWSPQRKYDLVIANIYSEILMAAAPRVVRSLKSEGTLILSGVLVSQCDEVLACFEQHGLRTEKVLKRGKWTAARCRLAK